MDPDRHLPIPGRKHPPAMMSPSAPDPQTRSIAPSAPTYQHSLPSIRQLHPYLPPSGATHTHLPAQDAPPYGYAPPIPYAGPSGSTDLHPSQTMPPGIHHRSEGPDSEGEGEVEHPEPVKKKRRRQALSCNECKRRKIKCDRAQPCGPCTRRGEQSKCQWRTLEPVDKYVTRAEYDELKSRSRAEYDALKARVDQLHAIVSRFFPIPSGPVNVPLYPMSSDPMPSAPPSESIPYHAGHASTGPAMYSSAVPPSSSYPGDHVPKPPQYPSNSPHLVTTALPAATPQLPPPTPGGGGSGGGPGHVRRTSASEAKSPATVRQSPLSLASITSPFNTDAQSKNCRAQTLNLPGERLRPVHPRLLLRPPRGEWKGLATFLCDTAHHKLCRRRWSTRMGPRRPLGTFLWKAHPWVSICPDHRREGDTANRA